MSGLEVIGKKYDQRIDQDEAENPLELELPGFRIIGQCGGGGTAKVYAAIQKSLGRQVALKVMHTSLSDNEHSTNRFIKEGLVNAKLTHSNIVTIHDVGVSDEYHYIAMEYLSCGSLRQRLNRKLELEWILKVAKQIASALAYAHENGFIHRDIKPENILFRDENSAVLSDFGIATVSHTQVQISDRCNFGTPRYMSPEQIKVETIGPTSDVYSLGVVLFEMLSGKPPFNDGDSIAIRNAHVNDPIPVLQGDYKDLQPIINRLLAKQPQDRIHSAHQVVHILEDIQKSRRVLSEDVSANVNNSSPALFEQDLKELDDLDSQSTDLTTQPFGYLKEKCSKLLHTSAIKCSALKEFIPSLGGTATLSIFLGLASLALFIMHTSEVPTISNDEITQQETQKNHDQYVNWALHHLNNNELKRAKYFIEKARVINPDDLVIQEVLASLNKKDRSIVVNQLNETSIITKTEKIDSAETATTDELLIRAKQQVLSNNLTTPPNNNAFSTYQRILKTEPGNADAIAGVSKIKRSYINWAEQELKKNNHHRAVLFYKKALAIDPSDTKLTQVFNNVIAKARH